MTDTAVFCTLIAIVVLLAALFMVGCGRGDRMREIGYVTSSVVYMKDSVTRIYTTSHKVEVAGCHAVKLGSRCFLRECAAPNVPEYAVLLIPAHGQAMMVVEIQEVGDE